MFPPVKDHLSDIVFRTTDLVVYIGDIACFLQFLKRERGHW